MPAGLVFDIILALLPGNRICRRIPVISSRSMGTPDFVSVSSNLYLWPPWSYEVQSWLKRCTNTQRIKKKKFNKFQCFSCQKTHNFIFITSKNYKLPVQKVRCKTKNDLIYKQYKKHNCKKVKKINPWTSTGCPKLYFNVKVFFFFRSSFS